MNSSSHLLVHESPQMTVLNLDLGGTIFTEGGHYSPVNNVLGGQYSPVNNVRGDIFGGDTVHYDNVIPIAYCYRMGTTLSLIFRRLATKFSNLVQKKNPPGPCLSRPILRSIQATKTR